MTQWKHQLESSDEGRRLLEQERVLFEATEAISRLMETQGVNRIELARRLDRTPAFVTKLLRGSNNFTLRTLADVFAALNRSVHVTIGPMSDEFRLPADCWVSSYRSPRIRVGEWSSMLAKCAVAHPATEVEPDESITEEAANVQFAMAA